MATHALGLGGENQVAKQWGDSALASGQLSDTMFAVSIDNAGFMDDTATVVRLFELARQKNKASENVWCSLLEALGRCGNADLLTSYYQQMNQTGWVLSDKTHRVYRSARALAQRPRAARIPDTLLQPGPQPTQPNQPNQPDQPHPDQPSPTLADQPISPSTSSFADRLDQDAAPTDPHQPAFPNPSFPSSPPHQPLLSELVLQADPSNPVHADDPTPPPSYQASPAKPASAPNPGPPSQPNPPARPSPFETAVRSALNPTPWAPPTSLHQPNPSHVQPNPSPPNPTLETTPNPAQFHQPVQPSQPKPTLQTAPNPPPATAHPQLHPTSPPVNPTPKRNPDPISEEDPDPSQFVPKLPVFKSPWTGPSPLRALFWRHVSPKKARPPPPGLLATITSRPVPESTELVLPLPRDSPTRREALSELDDIAMDDLAFSQAVKGRDMAFLNRMNARDRKRYEWWQKKLAQDEKKLAREEKKSAKALK